MPQEDSGGKAEMRRRGAPESVFRNQNSPDGGGNA